MKNIIDTRGIFLFLFFAVFPFGQIISFANLNGIDMVVGLAALYAFVKNLKKPEIFKYLNAFLAITIFSYFFSVFVFGFFNTVLGFMYLVRLTAYVYFLIYVWNFAKDENKKALVIDSLLLVCLASAIFGWVQLWWFPDLRPLFVFGWDEHLYRMFGTFLDPSYLGLILVFGSLIAIYRYIRVRESKYMYFFIFLVASLAFTYSRASYLALFAGAGVILFYYKKIKHFLLFVSAFLSIILFLPTSQNKILSVTRQFSAVYRIENYKNTLTIFSRSPVFGVGYNNMCLAYNKYIGLQSNKSHSCSGSDSSLLFILTTTGVIGFIIFTYSILNIRRMLLNTDNYMLLSSTFFALFVHSLFSNSVFYPWVIGWVIVLLGASLTKT